MRPRIREWVKANPDWTLAYVVLLLLLIWMVSCTNTMLAVEALPADWWLAAEGVVFGVGQDLVAILEWVLDLIL